MVVPLLFLAVAGTLAWLIKWDQPLTPLGVVLLFGIWILFQRFVMTTPVGDGDEEAAPPSIRVVENWYEEFQDRER